MDPRGPWGPSRGCGADAPETSMIQRPAGSHTPTRLAVLFGLLLGAAVVTAQQPAREQAATPRAGTGVIRGRAIRADTGAPLRRVQIRVDEWSTGDLRGPAATMTDAEGRYELTELPAGRYQLEATRGGYVAVAYGQRRPFERGRPLELGEGAVLRNIDFALAPGAVVTGRVVDEAGEPIAHASVSLARDARARSEALHVLAALGFSIVRTWSRIED